jgi:long-chain acyl-CoA synthetase
MGPHTHSQEGAIVQHEITQAELDDAVAGQTIISRYLQTVADHPQQVAIREKQADGSYLEWTYADHAERVASAAAHLRTLGVGPGDRVVLMMRNIPAFHFIDLGVAALGATAISIYNSSSPEQVAYLTGHCGAKLAILEDDGFAERFAKVRDELPALETVLNLRDDGVTEALLQGPGVDPPPRWGTAPPTPSPR